MSITKIKALAVTLAVAAAASAQFNAPSNARMGGMAGAPLSDITGVYSYPVTMLDYKGQIQATFFGGDEGASFIGIKGIGETFAIGILANQGLMTQPSEAFGGVETFPGANFAPLFNGNAYSRIPHLLLGFDLGAVKLGADIFFEYVGSSSDEEEVRAAGTIETSSSLTIMHPGARLSAAFAAGDIGIMVKGGIGLPSYNLEQTTPSAAGVSTTKTKPNSAMYTELGAEVGLPLMDIGWTLGGQYAFASHQLVKNGPENWHSIIDIYGSGEFSVLSSAKAAVGYSFTRLASTLITEMPAVAGVSANTSKETVGKHFHSFKAGLENVWDKAYFFDAVQLRAGCTYDISVDFDKGSNSNPVAGGDRAVESHQTTSVGVHDYVRPVMGFGLTKSFLQLDMAVSMERWGAALIGPPVAEVSATIKF